VLVGACAESLAGWGSFPNWEPEDGRAVLLGGAQYEVVGQAADGSMSFLLWGEPGRASVWGGVGLHRRSQNGKREVEGGTFEWDPVRSCWTGGCRKYELLAVG